MHRWIYDLVIRQTLADARRYLIKLLQVLVITMGLALIFFLASINKKTLWDVLELLFIPLVLAAIAIGFSNKEREKDREISASQLKETALQNYLDKMADLLLKDKLLEKKGMENDPTRDVAQVRTGTTLRTLDDKRRNILLQFLLDAHLFDFILVRASLADADLRVARLKDANLQDANLERADLRWASLQRANLRGAALQAADLRWALLIEAHLERAHLERAKAESAVLRRAHFEGAFLGPYLPGFVDSGANLRGADLMDADLQGADLQYALLQGADLTNADLTNANLKGAKVTNEQLAKAKSIKGATMPDGTVHE